MDDCGGKDGNMGQPLEWLTDKGTIGFFRFKHLNTGR